MPGAQYDQHNFYETSWVDPTRLPTDGPVIYDELPRHCTDQSAHLPETLGDRHPLKTRRDIASRHNFDEPPNSYDCIFSLPSLTPTDTISPKMDSPTVVTLKQAFLESTTRQLAQSVAPSRTWIRKNDVKGGGYGVNAAAATGGNAEDIRKRIPPKIVDEVLIRINQLLLLHARHIHTPAAIRHVAEQLDQLYQTADDKVVAVPGEGSSDSLERGMDYTTKPAISELPATWDDLQEIEALPLESHQYTEQVSQLQALAEQRTATLVRLQQLRGILSLLKHVSSFNAPAQRNLVTRDGPLETELGRMRVLLARVGDRVSSLPSPGSESAEAAFYTDEDMTDSTRTASIDTAYVEEVGRQRSQALLKLF